MSHTEILDKIGQLFVNPVRLLTTIAANAHKHRPQLVKIVRKATSIARAS